MSTRYFRLSDDVYIPGRWELGAPTDPRGREIDDPWQFADGKPVSIEGRLKLPIKRPGKPLDFSLAGIGVTPIVHARVASLLAELAPSDVQLIPVEIDSQTDPYCILVATHRIRCIDDEASEEVEYWMPEDGQPEKVGEYRNVAGMRIDPTRVGNTRLFRTWGWPIALVVSDELKAAMEHAGITGTRFKDVTGPAQAP
jgi:hypothetical protein